MSESNFEKLRVYQMAEELADEIWKVVALWDHVARDTMGKQMIRSADSIGANIAEGTGRGTYLDNKRFVRNARGSLYETKHWLRRAFKRKHLDEQQIKRLKPLTDNLAPMLNSYLKSIGKSADGGGKNY
jgi:four helix bundle protein